MAFIHVSSTSGLKIFTYPRVNHPFQSADTDLLRVIAKQNSMSRTITAVLNWVIGFAIGYIVAARSLDRSGALKSALVSGFVTAGVAWISYGRRE
jgi:hypothetical protein